MGAVSWLDSAPWLMCTAPRDLLWSGSSPWFPRPGSDPPSVDDLEELRVSLLIGNRRQVRELSVAGDSGFRV
jgi:hypothetical protein